MKANMITIKSIFETRNKSKIVHGIFLVATLFSFSTIVNGQAITLPKCMTPQAISYQNSISPGYAAAVDAAFESAKAYQVNHEAKSGSLYTIPVVVHIVYNTSAQDLPDSVIYNQIQVLNQDYNRLNADTVNMRPDFDPVKGNPKIEFILAQIDPTGNPTNGITRTATSTTSFGSLALLTGDFSDLEAVKSTANGGHDPWDQSRYLNIWVCNMSVLGFTALLGYATPPAGLPNWPPGSTAGLSDGVVIQYQAFGSNNPNPLDAGGGPIDVRGRTSVHEVGHYLGLRHIWGDGDCTAQDGIDDTPNADAQSNSDCDITKNTCTDNILGLDLPDMVENYMDYSAETCQNSFTQKQVDLMHGVLEVERYDLVHGNPAGIKDQDAVTISLYPNPANEVLHLKGLPQGMNIQVYTSHGQLVLAEYTESDEAEFAISSLSSGIYTVALSNSDKRSFLKFVKR